MGDVMNVIWVNGSAELADKATQILLRLLDDKPEAAIALPTGNTPLGLYHQLRSMRAAGRLHCDEARFFNLDDFVGKAPDDPQSYGAFLWRHVFRPLNISKEQVRLLRGDAPDIGAECRSFDQAIAEVGGLDLAILGLGSNGHVAFNEPGSAWDSPTREVSLTEETRRAQQSLYKRVSDVPSRGITMGLKTIRDARHILLLVSGTAKAGALQRLLSGERDPNWPVTALADHPHLHVVADRALAGPSHTPDDPKT